MLVWFVAATAADPVEMVRCLACGKCWPAAMPVATASDGRWCWHGSMN